MKILTPSGFQTFSGVACNGVREVGVVDIDGEQLECTDNHRVKINGEWVEAKDLGQEMTRECLVYDPVEVAGGHEYLIGNIVNHNCDEFAHVDKDLEFWTSVFPTISSGNTTKVIITSTPRGLNLFYKLWKESTEKKNPFKSAFYPWTENPTRNAKWEKEQLETLGVLKFRQEVLCEFQGSAGTLISGEKLQKLTWSEPIYRTDDNVMRMYKRPKKGHKYVMTVDVSEGVDRDYSVASVFDVTTKPFRHVAMYRCNSVAPEVFTSIINQLGRQYNDAVAIVETNSIGAAVAKDLWFEFEYENVLKTVTRDTGAKVGYGSGSVLGVRTTKATKRQGCSTLKSLIETDLLITEDYDAIHEFGTFIAHGSSWAAEEGKTDDVVMTFVIFAWFTQQVTFEEYMAGSMNSELRKAREDETMGALAAFLDGPDDFMDGDEDLSLVA